MDDVAELDDIVTRLRRIGAETEDVEVKSGKGGYPKSVLESVVGFANGDGGTVIIGLDEASGFTAVDVPDIATYRNTIAQSARDDVEPSLRVATTLVAFEGRTVLVVRVPAVTAQERPVYVKAKGVTTGAFIRSGDGDRRMNQAEIALLYSSRSQPEYDRELVPGTSVADLDEDAVRRTLQRARSGSAALSRSDDTTALRRMGVLAELSPDSPLTLGGLLTFGTYPQAWFPQLMMSVVVHPPTGTVDTRFLDNATIRGPIPSMVAEALNMLRRNLAARAAMGEMGRRELLEFPLEAIREALVNAVMHRDYSPVTRGTQIQVDLYPDRLEIRSPGGIYGGIAVEDLGHEGVSSSRNAVLASLLSDTFLPGSADLVAENRASGVSTMIDLARTNGLPRPVFRSTIASFVVTMGRSQLLDPETRTWIASLGIPTLSSAHFVALAMMRKGYATNSTLREWGIDRVAASQVLRDLVEQGVAVKEGGRRYAQYVLEPSVLDREHVTADLFTDLLPDVETELRRRIVATAVDLQSATGLSRRTVLNRIDHLVADGRVVAEGAPRSPKRRYRWISDSGRPAR